MALKKGFKTFFFGLFLTAVGAIILPYFMIKPLFDAEYPEFTFKVPSQETFKIDTPGKYYLWNDFNTMFEGKNYSVSERLPNGAQIKITHSETGEEIEFTPDTSISIEIGGSSQKSIGYVELKGDESVNLRVENLDEERVFTFAQSRMMEIMGTLATTFLLAGILTVSGIIFLIWGIIRLTSKKARLKVESV